MGQEGSFITCTQGDVFFIKIHDKKVSCPLQGFGLDGL